MPRAPANSPSSHSTWDAVYELWKIDTIGVWKPDIRQSPASVVAVLPQFHRMDPFQPRELVDQMG